MFLIFFDDAKVEIFLHDKQIFVQLFLKYFFMLVFCVPCTHWLSAHVHLVIAVVLKTILAV